MNKGGWCILLELFMRIKYLVAKICKFSGKCKRKLGYVTKNVSIMFPEGYCF